MAGLRQVPWVQQGQGGCMGDTWGAAFVGLTTPLHPQPEEVAQEAVEEPLVEPLLEPEGENYEEPPQVRGRGGTAGGVAALSPAASRAGWRGAGGHRGSVPQGNSLTGFFFAHPAGGIPGVRARGIMDPRPCLFHQQHNEPPVAPCSSPASPGRCPRAGEEQGCPCPVQSQVLPPVPFQGTVSVSPYRV